MSKVKFFAGNQEVRIPEKGRGLAAFGAVPAHLQRESKPREVKPSPIHDAIVDVLSHEALGGVAHVDDIQAGLLHLHDMAYKQSPLYGHLKNAVKLGRIFKVDGKRGFYSVAPIATVQDADGVEAEASADFDEDEGFEAHEHEPAPEPIVAAKPVIKPAVRPLGVGRIVR